MLIERHEGKVGEADGQYGIVVMADCALGIGE
jgi:hypothetical protein